MKWFKLLWIIFLLNTLPSCLTTTIPTKTTTITSLRNSSSVKTKIIKSLPEEQLLNYRKTKVWGPGLRPENIVYPARYFFIHAVDSAGKE